MEIKNRKATINDIKMLIANKLDIIINGNSSEKQSKEKIDDLK